MPLSPFHIHTPPTGEFILPIPLSHDHHINGKQLGMVITIPHGTPGQLRGMRLDLGVVGSNDGVTLKDHDIVDHSAVVFI